jgi:hypothetical protein
MSFALFAFGGKPGEHGNREDTETFLLSCAPDVNAGGIRACLPGIAPVGAGTPAAGSSVTAKVSTAPSPESPPHAHASHAFGVHREDSAGTGALPPWPRLVSLALGSRRQPLCDSRPPAVSCQSILAPAPGRPGGLRARRPGRRIPSSATSDRWRSSSRFSAAVSWRAEHAPVVGGRDDSAHRDGGYAAAMAPESTGPRRSA